MTGKILIGTSGWRYASWRGQFYPCDLPQRLELSYLAERLDSAELNGSFYSLQRPSSYLRWAGQTPDDFVFAVKGSRFITHLRRLSGVEAALANFFASGILALGAKLGPVLWQLPPTLAFDATLLDAFLAILPRSTAEAAALALRHDARLDDRSWTTTDQDRPIRHALEVRHDSYRGPRLASLLQKHNVALVVSDGAAKWPLLETVTADFLYLRLHGAEELYTSGYDEPALRIWAAKIATWTSADHDVYVYFDNDAEVRAPTDAAALRQILRSHA